MVLTARSGRLFPQTSKAPTQRAESPSTSTLPKAGSTLLLRGRVFLRAAGEQMYEQTYELLYGC